MKKHVEPGLKPGSTRFWKYLLKYCHTILNLFTVYTSNLTTDEKPACLL